MCALNEDDKRDDHGHDHDDDEDGTKRFYYLFSFCHGSQR